MEKNWDLNFLYKSFDEKYNNDLKELENLINQLNNIVSENRQDNLLFLENILDKLEKITTLEYELINYASLVSSTDVNNNEAQVYLSKISDIANLMTGSMVDFSRRIKRINLSELSNKSAIIKRNYFVLENIKKDAKYLLSKKEEELYAKLSQLASSSWSDLQSLATANLVVDYNNEKYTLSQIRNLAYSEDADVRKSAYEAELASYEKVADFVAMALSNIKREVNIMSKLKGYKSVIEKTLISSHMDIKTLNALISSIKESRKYFAKYLKAKAKYLSNNKSLPFYDLFARCGKYDKKFTYEEACNLVIDAFNSYSTKLGDFAKRAIENNWIDVYPKSGKVGGAFCANIPSKNESRVLTNFDGSLSSVFTLAHELGHAYHGDIISAHTPLNWDYPMELAETASIFCETIMNNYLLSKVTNKEERLAILENNLQDDTQVLIDILSRYLFEQKLIAAACVPLNKESLKEMMLEAQKEAYLDGLDSDKLHPYMWLCKGHYYSAGLNFYNFPYAFGLLYGKGLYSLYKQDKQNFLKKYDDMLLATCTMSAEQCAGTLGIDITKKDFWLLSIKDIKNTIDEVCKLLKS